jgi:S1-C subfamily serine protease
MRDTDSSKFIAYLAIIATSFALGAFVLTWAPSIQYSNENPAKDGFVAPRSIVDLVDRTQESTVTVWCDATSKKSWFGTAWAIDLDTKKSKTHPTTLITNHHVIEDCIGIEGSITIALPYEEPAKAVLVKWDKKNDLAVLATATKLPVLQLSENSPWPGYWVMALGSADGYEGSVSFGNVLNTDGYDIFITNNISHGNSGGPLIDNEGYVIGVTSWSHKLEQYNGSVSLDAFCEKITDCQYKWKGKETWWDYND